jgi:hypothetical protein
MHNLYTTVFMLVPTMTKNLGIMAKDIKIKSRSYCFCWNLDNQDVPGKPECSWKTRMLLENQDVPGKPGCHWKTRMLLENQDVPGKPGCPWETRMFLENQDVPGKPGCRVSLNCSVFIAAS